MTQHHVRGGSDGDEVPTAIDSPRDPAARRIADVLKRSRGTPRTILLEDEQIIEQAVRAGVALDSAYYALGAARGPEHLRRLLPPEVPLHGVADSVLDVLFGSTKKPRVFALGRRWKPPQLECLSDRHGDIVVLDGVKLTGNIGAVTRSAAAFGAAGVVLIESGLNSIVDRRLLRASRGLVFTIPVVIASRAQLLQHLERRDIPIVSLDPHANADLRQAGHVGEHLALLLGSERHGASDELAARAKLSVRIPVHPHVESLNVSVAAAVTLYERHRAALSAGPRDRVDFLACSST